MKDSPPLRVLIADDEPISRRRLKRLLLQSGEAISVVEAKDCDQTVQMVTTLNPDLLLLDIQMPGGDGFSVLDRLANTAAPAVVFVTAFDQYARSAFDVAAVDYLTKPVEMPRLQEALLRVRKLQAARIRNSQVTELQALVAKLRAVAGENQDSVRYLWAKGNKSHHRIVIDRIEYIRAERDYVRVFTEAGSYLISETMSAIEATLLPLGFLRIHRSTLVRRDFVDSLNRRHHGSIALVMACGTELPVGRSYMQNVLFEFGLKVKIDTTSVGFPP
jgi:two-component system, LytTR family, response regulator